MGRAIRSDNGVSALRPKAKAYLAAVADVPGLFVRVMPSGAKSFVVIARAPSGKQVWHRIDNTALTVEDAQTKARAALKKIKGGKSLAPAESFDAVAAEWVKRHVDKKGLRSKPTIDHYLNNYILPAWGKLPFVSIRRGHVAKLLDEIEDSAGARAADYVLAIVRGICNWHATRVEDYNSPIVRGMRRSNPKEQERKRVLDDAEIRRLWAATDGAGFGAFLRLLLLTGQRRETVAAMRWEDVEDGVWIIPSEDRAKGTGRELALPEIALETISKQGRFADNPYVFAGRKGSHLSGYSKGKKAIEAKLLSLMPLDRNKKPLPVPEWRLHDLRRTAKTLMARAGVRPDVGERVLGHAIKGVEGTYDQHDYRDEKADALRKLAKLIKTILNPPSGNVVRIAR